MAVCNTKSLDYQIHNNQYVNEVEFFRGARLAGSNIVIPIFQSQAGQLKAEYLELSENLIHICLIYLNFGAFDVPSRRLFDYK